MKNAQQSSSLASTISSRKFFRKFSGTDIITSKVISKTCILDIFGQGSKVLSIPVRVDYLLSRQTELQTLDHNEVIFKKILYCHSTRSLLQDLDRHQNIWDSSYHHSTWALCLSWLTPLHENLIVTAIQTRLLFVAWDFDCLSYSGFLFLQLVIVTMGPWLSLL